MDLESLNALIQENNIDEVLAQIIKQPKQKYSQEEIDEARDNLMLMNDRVFFVTFTDNKNNHIIEALTNALRKIHKLLPIPPIKKTTVQNATLLDILGHGMVGDLLGEANMLNITLEAQKEKQGGYAVRGILTSSNAMRLQFNSGDNYTEAPDVIGINILGFRLPELAGEEMFCSRITRSVYDSGKPFLADKYSDYFIELPKMDNWSKSTLPEEYHDLWDICCIFKTKIKDMKEVIHMQAIANPAALDLSKAVETTVLGSEFMDETMKRKKEWLEVFEYFGKQIQKNEEKIKEKIEKQIKEEMILTAIKNGVPSDVIMIMCNTAGIMEFRLNELKIQAQSA